MSKKKIERYSMYYPIIYLGHKQSIGILNVNNPDESRCITWSRKHTDITWDVTFNHITYEDKKGTPQEMRSYLIQNPTGLARYLLDNNYRGYTEIPNCSTIKEVLAKYRLGDGDDTWLDGVYAAGNKIGWFSTLVTDGVPEFNRWCTVYQNRR